MSRAPIAMVRDDKGLHGLDAYSAQQLDELPPGNYTVRFSRMTAAFKTEREGLRGLFFAGLQLLSENTEDLRYDTKDKAYNAIREDLGYTRRRYRVDGTWEPVPMSTSEAEMDDAEFAILLERSRAHCVNTFGFDPFSLWTDQQEIGHK